MNILITSISSIIGSATALLLAFYIFSQGLKDKVRFSYFLAALMAGLWLFFYTIWLWQSDKTIALMLIRVVMFFAILTYPTLLHFVLRFLNYNKRLIFLLAYLSAAILGYVCLFTNLFISGVTQKLAYPYWGIRGGVFFDIYVLIWIIVIVFSLSLLLKKFRSESNSFKKAQMRYVLLGLTLGYIGGATNFFLWYDVPIPPFGNILIPIYFLLIAYAIVKYRFADIRMVIRRSAVFTVLVTVITAIYALIAYLITLFFQGIIGAQSAILNGIITAIFVAIGFEPLKNWLSRVTDTFLFKAEYKPQEVLAEFSDQLTSTLDLDSISEFIVSETHLIFKCTKASLFLWNKETGKYQVASRIDSQKDKLEFIEETLFAKIFEYFKNHNLEKDIIVRDEMKKVNEQLKNNVLSLLIEQLDKYEVSLVVPMYVKAELVGILFLGDKKSGDIYSSEDIRVLGIIAGQAAITIKNAQLFDEQKHFTEHLKIEIDKATKELKVANIQLKKLDEAKSEFISIASHQLRTPLTVIKGYLSMIDQKDFGEVPEKILAPLDRVSKSTARIIGLVEDLLNILRIESGRLKYDFENVDLDALAREVFEELEMHAKNRGLVFSYHKPTKKIPLLKLDRNKIRETLMNLMDNAIKYTENGKVDVSLEKLDHTVRFSVKDTGRGIAPDEMPQLFQKFSRAKGVQLMHTEGTGLGLYIAKEILKKHHAKIWVESPGTNKGSTFIIEFRIG
jgi:signal transduction histidine kinase